jgi:hypothetical protein
MTTTKKLIVLLAAALGACGEDTSGIVIRGRAVVGEPPECAIAASGDFQLGPGLLDVGPGTRPAYFLPLYLKNSLSVPPTTSGGAPSQQKTWFSHAARVSVRPGGASATISHAPVGVEAGGGEAGELFEVVNAELGAALQLLAPAGVDERRRVMLDITLEGATQDGEELDTREFSYPLDLCSGCLAAPVCAPGETFAPMCLAGQDTVPVCQAAGATP